MVLIMVSKVMFSSKTDEWSTPQDLFDNLNQEFHFTLDVCATSSNAKCKKYFTREQDGLIQNWDNEIVWCNPPYGREIGLWVKKCFEHKNTAVMLLPARTDTKWFHEYIYHKAEIRFIKGRLKFESAKNTAPFPSMIILFNNMI